MAALGEGNHAEEDVFRYARDAMGYQRLGPKIRQSFVTATRLLVRDGWVSSEEGEYFLTTEDRNADVGLGRAPIYVLWVIATGPTDRDRGGGVGSATDATDARGFAAFPCRHTKTGTWGNQGSGRTDRLRAA
jgi:hypothetical protein